MLAAGHPGEEAVVSGGVQLNVTWTPYNVSTSATATATTGANGSTAGDNRTWTTQDNFNYVWNAAVGSKTLPLLGKVAGDSSLPASIFQYQNTHVSGCSNTRRPRLGLLFGSARGIVLVSSVPITSLRPGVLLTRMQSEYRCYDGAWCMVCGVGSKTSATACQALCAANPACHAYTWHDKHNTKQYKLDCVGRTDGRYENHPQQHHFSGRDATATPIGPGPSPSPHPGKSKQRSKFTPEY